jgi:DNA-binding transcriptional MocR family regulator
MMTTVGVRLSADLMAALQEEATRRDLTPSEVMRLALVQFLSASAHHEQWQTLQYEIAKTRAVLLRFIDRQHGEQLADEILAVAGTDAELYLQRQPSR